MNNMHQTVAFFCAIEHEYSYEFKWPQMIVNLFAHSLSEYIDRYICIIFIIIII